MNQAKSIRDVERAGKPEIHVLGKFVFLLIKQ